MTKDQRPDIEPWHRFAVDGITAARLMNCDHATFMDRVGRGVYPAAQADGQWSVAELRQLHDPWFRVAVDSITAAKMLGCGHSTFFKRVRAGVYPKAGVDKRWSVAELRKVHEARDGQAA